MKRYLTGLSVGLLLAGFAIIGLSTDIAKASGGENGGGAIAAPTVPVTCGDGWHSFQFNGIIDSAGSDCLTYTSTGATVVTVTDAFCIGDEFHVFDNNVFLCDTSLVASEPGCTGITDPDAAIASGLYSNATCKICSAGDHEICVTVKDLWNPGSGGGAFFRVDCATCTVAEACAEGGAAADAACPPGGVYRNHGAYVSCVAAATNAYLATLTGFTSDELEEISSCIVNPRARSTVGR